MDREGACDRSPKRSRPEAHRDTRRDPCRIRASLIDTCTIRARPDLKSPGKPDARTRGNTLSHPLYEDFMKKL
jgi:hypothetical protein